MSKLPLRLVNKNIMTNFARKKHLWTPENVVKSPCQDIRIPEVTLVEHIWTKMEKWPTKTATVCSITNRQYTYEQIYKNSRTLGAKLRKDFGIRDDDTVAVMMPNMPEYPSVVFGVLEAGGVVSTINPIYTPHEVYRQLDLSGAKAIVGTPETVPTIKQSLQLLKKNLPILTVNINEPVPENTVSVLELIDDKHTDLSILKEVRRKHDDVCLLPYSSGTTGLPKGVQLTNRNIIANCIQQDTELRQYTYTSASHQDSVLVVVPMFHSYGLSMVMIQKLSAGLKEVILPGFKPKTFIDTLANHEINLLFAAPPLLLFMGAVPEVTDKHLQHLTCLVCGAAPLPNSDIYKVFNKAKREVDFVHGYGLTETGPLATCTPRGSKIYSTVGYAIPSVQLRIVDDKFNTLGPNEVGELVIKGPNVMKGYKNNPEGNKDTFLEDGWLRTGDQAKIDEDGVVTIADRLKELIKVKGFQVPPAELENVLKEHPDILDAAVIGIPDLMNGERPKAFIVLHKDKQLDDKTLEEFVNEKVAPYKRIKDFVFTDSIPKNPSGKILRRVLKEQFS